MYTMGQSIQLIYFQLLCVTPYILLLVYKICMIVQSLIQINNSLIYILQKLTIQTEVFCYIRSVDLVTKSTRRHCWITN